MGRKEGERDILVGGREGGRKERRGLVCLGTWEGGRYKELQGQVVPQKVLQPIRRRYHGRK